MAICTSWMFANAPGYRATNWSDQELLNFETDQGSKPNGNSNDIGLSSNKISSKGRIFDPSQLITPARNPSSAQDQRRGGFLLTVCH
uniref:Uncharacterized protein n=1 Tax=Fagus sylvatica TaxID=28930 RepID=A0A2N9FRC6_FAGSY